MIDEPKGRGTEGGGWDKRRKGKDKCYREGTRTKDSEREELVMHGVARGRIENPRASEHRGIKERSKERRAFVLLEDQQALTRRGDAHACDL